MGDMKFIMANVVAILLLAVTLGPLGGADMLDEDLVIGDAEELVADGEIDNLDDVDFDTSRLVFDFEDDWLARFEQGVTWSGETNHRDEDYGYLTFNVTDFDGLITITANIPTLTFITPRIELYAAENFDDFNEDTDIQYVGRVRSGDSQTEFDVSNYDYVELRVYDNEQYILSVSSFEIEDLTIEEYLLDQDEIVEEQLDIEDNLLRQLISTLRTGFNILGQVPGVLWAWIDFSFAIPGIAGFLFQGYVLAFVLFFLVIYVWVG